MVTALIVKLAHVDSTVSHAQTICTLRPDVLPHLHLDVLVAPMVMFTMATMVTMGCALPVLLGKPVWGPLLQF